MITNLDFKSNVYPVDGFIQSDKVFLSKIKDYSKLKELDKKYFRLNSNSIWSKLQLKIIAESPTCSLDKLHDPCWGMVKSKGEYQWECKCVNTTCNHFSKCRSTYDENEFNLFSPHVNTLIGYRNNFNEAIQIVYPVIYSERDEFYGEFVEHRKPQLTEEKAEEQTSTEEKGVQIVEVISRIESAEHSEKIQQLNNEEVNFENYEEEFDVPQADIAADQFITDYTNNIPVNMFDSFQPMEQDEVITASPSDVIFVDAGPGTGKTYTLIQKINYLVTNCDVDPESLIVLCFTNAAVDEIQKRLYEFIRSGGPRSLANVDIRTFHSFAWWLIGQANDLFVEDGWHRVSMGNLNYEKSLEVASEIICKFSLRVVDSWEHFIVDEVQDLTNNLARFVLNIVDACLKANCGITAFGDSCQAIYDYTQENSYNPMTSEDFYKALFRKLYSTAQFGKFSINHRQTNKLVTLTSGLRESILNQNHPQMKSEVFGLINSINQIEKTDVDIQADELQKLNSSGKTCLLFRNNGQTLKISSTLRKRGINHVLNAFETQQNFAPWISEVFFSYSKATISYDEFELLYENALTKNKHITADVIWERIQMLMHSHNSVLHVAELLQAIGSAKIDDPILRTKQTGEIIVSNIHRAKGREYDCVIIDKSFADNLTSGNSKIGEYKTMYVAVTRPKVLLVTASFTKPGDMQLIRIFDSNRKRWGKTKKKRITYFEINSGIDIDISSYLYADQLYLSNIKEGDQIELRRVLGKNKVDYDIIHYTDDSPNKIGQIGKSFINDLISYMRISNSELIEMPATIDDLYVSGVYTHIASEDFMKLNPQISDVSPNGIWKWVEFAGIGHANYDVY